jgi:hypothetical protein
MDPSPSKKLKVRSCRFVAVSISTIRDFYGDPPASQSDAVDVVIVGCSLPGKGMGWYHATNIIEGECPSARLTDIVEPYFLGEGASSPAATPFHEFVAAHPEIRFHKVCKFRAHRARGD